MRAFTTCSKQSTQEGNAQRASSLKVNATCRSARSGANKPCAISRASRNRGEVAPCCSKRLCASCNLSLLRVCLCESEPRFCATCPFCRQDYQATPALVRHCMASCQSHAKVAFCRCEQKDVVVVHKPCNCGSYDCSESEVVVRTLP